MLAGEIWEQALAYSDHRPKQLLYPRAEVIDNIEGKGTRTVSFQFHNLVNKSGSRP